MRATTLLRSQLQLKDTRVVAVSFDARGMVVDVAPTWRRGRCSVCDEPCPGYDRRQRYWRHLDATGMMVYLRYSLRRVRCRRCKGIKVERVPWAEPSSCFTVEFEDQVGYRAQQSAKTTVSKDLRVAWETVGAIIQRVVARHRPTDELDGLTQIGVDELSYRRHHEYITVVVDHVRGGIVWAKRGKNAETLKAFFADLGPARCAKLQAVTIDMSAAYIQAVTECAPQAEVIFDRFHVQRLVQDAVDAVRRDEVRAAPAADRKQLKGTRWALLKSVWNLTLFESGRLVDLQRQNKRLYRAYLLKEAVVRLLGSPDERFARWKLTEWIRWARRSRLAPFKRVAATLRTHAEGILAYVRTGLSNGRTEGLNGKARTLTRRAYGFHSASALIALLKLCCSRIHLQPIHHWPGTAH
jgi:transposase